MYQVVIFGSMNNGSGYLKSCAIHRLATEVRQMGYTCRPIDAFVQVKDSAFRMLIDKFVDMETRIVGISTTLLSSYSTKNTPSPDDMFWGIPDDRFRARIEYVRKKAPKAIIVAGGSQIKTNNTDLKNYRDCIDLFVEGQGEGPIRSLVRTMFEGKSTKTRDIDGLPFVLQEDHPYNDFQNSRIVWLPEDRIFQGEALTLEVARGCVFKCSYCTYDLTGKEWGDMMKSPECLREELIKNYTLWGTTMYMIPDDTLNDSMEKVRALHEVFTSLPFKIRFVTYIRLDLIWKHREMAQLLLEMGLVGCSIGVETMDKRAGRLIGKGLGEERIKETMAFLKDVWGTKVVTKLNFIMGLPYESRESMERTVRWLLEDDCPSHSADIFSLRVNGNGQLSRMELEEVERYGYTFDPDNPSMWRRSCDGMSMQDAFGIQQDAYHRLYDKKPWTEIVSAFGIPAFHNAGLTYNDVKYILDNHNSEYAIGEFSTRLKTGSAACVERYIHSLIVDDYQPQTLSHK